MLIFRELKSTSGAYFAKKILIGEYGSLKYFYDPNNVRKTWVKVFIWKIAVYSDFIPESNIRLFELVF